MKSSLLGCLVGAFLAHFCLDTSDNVLKSLDYRNFFLCEFPLGRSDNKINFEIEQLAAVQSQIPEMFM